MKKIILISIMTLFTSELMAQQLYLRPELGVSPIGTAEGKQFTGFTTSINAGFENQVIYGELGLGRSSSELIEDEEISRTAFQITGGLRPSELFKMSGTIFPLVKGESDNDFHQYSGKGFGLNMGWQPMQNVFLRGQYRYQSLAEENNGAEINFSEFMLSISYLFYN